MLQPFGVISDTHNHNWSAFATVDPANNVNSRLSTTLYETYRCAMEVKSAGGKRLYHCGDLFHVRGSVAPSVLNPTLDVYKSISAFVEIRILAGNHDLEFRESNRNGSAVTALEGAGCKIVNETTLFEDDRVAMIPWQQNVQDLEAEIKRVISLISATPSPAPLRSMESVSDWTLMIHAPVDGVIKGLPPHGLTDVRLASFGFKRVFSGHYHHHKDFGNNVYSVGALTHNTWSDVGSKAGFLLADDSGVKWFQTHAPHFVEIDGSMDETEATLAADGNYVRCTMTSDKSADVEQMREFLEKSGAKGINILYQKKVIEVERESTSSVSAGASIETSIADYVGKYKTTRPAELSALCQSILADARMEISR